MNEGGEIAWALRKESPQLMAAINGFMWTGAKGTMLGNILAKRYFGDIERVRNALAPGEDRSSSRPSGSSAGMPRLTTSTRSWSRRRAIESGLDQSKRSAAGAVGIMQIMPATAGDPNVAIPDIHIAERNVAAGSSICASCATAISAIRD